MKPDVVQYFKSKSRASDIKISEKTIKNSFFSSHGLSPNTQLFFQTYIPSAVKEYSFSSFSEELRLFIDKDINRHAETVQQFDKHLAEAHRGDMQSTAAQLTTFNYIGQLQNPTLAFHNPVRQPEFWGQLLSAVKSAFKADLGLGTRLLFKSVKPGHFPAFEVSFLEVAKFNGNAQAALVCQLGGELTPDGPSATEFALKASQGRAVHDSPSFGVAGLAMSQQGQCTVDLRWTTYLRSLESHDAFYMQAIYAFGTNMEEKKLKDLTENVTGILRTRGSISKPILGVTTAIVFKRDLDGPYWTFVQLKDGGASRIPEAHLTPSFVHQPVTKMKRSLPDEVSDIEFHIYRELIEEIFNFPENIHSDFTFYRQLVEDHFAISHIKQLISRSLAGLQLSKLILDMHRAKFELIYVLRIDDPAWFAAIGQHIQANHEAIKGGVVLAPLDAQGIHEALTGTLTYSKPARRMCSPGQAALLAAIEHLKSRHDPHVKNVVITSTELGPK